MSTNSLLIPSTSGKYMKVFSDVSYYTKKIQNLSSGQPLYIGESESGSATTASVWRIRKMEYDDGNNYPPTGEVWANGTAKFDKAWTNRVTYIFG